MNKTLAGLLLLGLGITSGNSCLAQEGTGKIRTGLQVGPLSAGDVGPAVMPPRPPDPPIHIVHGYQRTTSRQVAAQPWRWHGRRVRIRGLYESGFEVSALDGLIWLSGNTTVQGMPDIDAQCKCRCHGGMDIEHETACCVPEEVHRHKHPWGHRSLEVEVWGRLETAQHHYGHLGAYRAELEVDRMVYVGHHQPIYREMRE